MKKSFLALCVILAATLPGHGSEARVWTDTKNRKLEARFVKLEGESVYLQMADGLVHAIPLAALSLSDQKEARSLPPAKDAAALLSIPPNASVTQAATKIDQLVASGLQRANLKLADAARQANEQNQPEGKRPAHGLPLKANPMTTDEQFVRRIYLDAAGRIPTYEETVGFLNSSAPDKRAKLIDVLLDSEGYASTMFNYFADMLRVNDYFNRSLRGTPYRNWLREQMRANTPWDKMVYEMITAEGKLWDNGATGFLLRDAGMPLDNLANTLASFLATDVSCAQCHDHPFAAWTQREFYEMAAFFGATTTNLTKPDYVSGSNPKNRLVKQAGEVIKSRGGDPAKYNQPLKIILEANQYAVKNRESNRMKLPFDYKYKDGAPGQPVTPKFISWGASEKSSLFQKSSVKTVETDPSQLRITFADWMTSPTNPRFAMAIANRMWERAMGKALSPSIHNLDHPEDSYNPELLHHLASEMVRVKFNLKDFMRIVYNSKTYQREASTTDAPMGEPYYFQGPLLRRMEAEQAWDSFITLLTGNPDAAKNQLEDLYGRTIDMNLNTVDVTTVLLKVNAYLQATQKVNARTIAKGGLEAAGDDEMAADGKAVRYKGLTLMRASELPQPAPAGHFLRAFGQSDRLVLDDNSVDGTLPQVLLMMNGAPQEMLTNKDSLILRTVAKSAAPAEKVETLFLSVLNRRPTLREKEMAKRLLSEGPESAYANMIWGLVNTREFYFIQ